MSNTDKVMELAESINPYPIGSPKEAWRKGFLGNTNLGAKGSDYDRQYKQGAKARAHIEAMQRDCRTCGHLFVGKFCKAQEMNNGNNCTNHNQWTPVEFKQLTRSE